MLLSIVIKCLNEQDNIARAIESALFVTKICGGEVIVVDSLSSDNTVDIASRYPVKIVQFFEHEDRCCGSAAQLGYQYVKSEYFYLMDGDMAVQVNFVMHALDFLRSNQSYAGVAGALIDVNTSNIEFQLRAGRAARERPIGDVDRLDGGGLYRSAAIASVSYFADRNLCSFEELELGIRLRAAGWKLFRIPELAVEHYGYNTLGGYALLARRWKTKYAFGLGQLLRSASMRRRPFVLLNSVRLFPISIFIYIWLISLVSTFIIFDTKKAIFWTSIIFFIPLVYTSSRNRSLSAGLYSFTSWIVNSAGLIAGILYYKHSPIDPIESRVLVDNGQSPSDEFRAHDSLIHQSPSTG